MISIPRVSRKELNTPFLHVMAQGMNKEYIFKNKEYIEIYLNLLRKYIKEYQVTIIAYCVMNNHVHLLTYTEKIEELSGLMHKVNLVYSQFYNKTNNRCGMVFRNRYKAEPIYNLTYLINCINYIHLNPVKAKMVKKCEDYPYSSYNQYINNGKITRSKIMLELFGKNYNYSKLLDIKSKFIFIDIEKTSQEEIREIMDIAINDFLKNNSIRLEELFSNKIELCKLIKKLKMDYKFRYIDIMKRFGISKSKLQELK